MRVRRAENRAFWRVDRSSGQHCLVKILGNLGLGQETIAPVAPVSTKIAIRPVYVRRRPNYRRDSTKTRLETHSRRPEVLIAASRSPKHEDCLSGNVKGYRKNCSQDRLAPIPLTYFYLYFAIPSTIFSHLPIE